MSRIQRVTSCSARYGTLHDIHIIIPPHGCALLPEILKLKLMFHMEKILTHDEHTFKKVPIFLKCQVSINPWSTKQWQIQYFPLGAPSHWRGPTSDGALLAKMYAKTKELDPIEGGWGGGGGGGGSRAGCAPPWIRQC